MKKLILAFSVLITSLVFAQNSPWTFGGSFGINNRFGANSGFGVHISPRAGYKVSENLEIGMTAGIDWQNSSYSYSTLFGTGPYANYYFGRKFYLSSQFQEYIINQNIKSTDTRVGYNESALYFGGGYIQQINTHTYLQIGVLYNLLWKETSSIFSSGFTPNIGIVFGL